jgi:two-component system nitrate/nitrite response regulator NarL
MTIETRTPSEIHVLVAEDHPLVLAETARALSAHPRITVVAEIDDGREALRAIVAMRPDVAVLDLDLPSLSGQQLIDTVRREQLPTRVVVLSAHCDGPRVHRAVAGGARGCLAKTSTSAEVVRAVQRVFEGEAVLPAEIVNALVGEIRELPDEPEVLTDREREILRLAADGLPTAEIGGHLDLDVGVIKGDLQDIYHKLEVEDRASAVARAIRHQLI